MKTAAEMIEYYTNSGLPDHWMREIIDQYVSMANGGDGGVVFGNGWGDDDDPRQITCREYNYPGQPDSFFQEVCDGMGWDWKSSQ